MSKKVMINGEEYEIEEDRNPVAQEIVQHFSGVSEEELEQYQERDTEIAALEALNEPIKKRLVDDAKKSGAEFYQRGKFVAVFEHVKGAKRLDPKKVKKFLEDQLGKLSDTDLEALYTEGAPQTRFKGVKKL